MLVPLVLRNIVLPYLRSTPAAAAATAAAATQAFSTTSTSRRAAEAVAALGEQLDDPFRQSRPWTSSQALRHDRLLDHDPPRLRRGSLSPVKREEGPVRLSQAEDRKPTEPIPQRSEPQPTAPATEPKASVFDRSRPPPAVDVPPGVAQLLEARLYRMAAFQVLGSPELVSDTELVDHVARKLEKNGAGKLARRLRRSVEIAAETPGQGDKVRLWSDPRPADAARRPPDFWRVDRTIPRHDGAYPGNTPAERRTHHFNQQLTRLLTLRHALPYELHLGPDPRAPPPKLRRVRDLLHYIDRLRAHHSFVPDRVTANIVVKAWLVNLARGTHGHGEGARAKFGRDGLEKAELRGVFEFVSASMNAEVEKSGGQPKPAVLGIDGALPFDSSLDFDRHVKPFAKIMLRAMRRVGDHEGREVVSKWRERMEVELKGKHEEVEEVASRKED